MASSFDCRPPPLGMTDTRHPPQDGWTAAMMRRRRGGDESDVDSDGGGPDVRAEVLALARDFLAATSFQVTLQLTRCDACRRGL